MKQQPLFTDAFEDFWQLYPRRQAKLDARKAWSKLNPSLELVQAILAAVEVQRRSQEWRKDGGQWVPLPASWLRAGRWMDEVKALVEPSGESRKDCQHEPRCVSNIWHSIMLERDRKKSSSPADSC